MISKIKKKILSNFERYLSQNLSLVDFGRLVLYPRRSNILGGRKWTFQNRTGKKWTAQKRAIEIGSVKNGWTKSERAKCGRNKIWTGAKVDGERLESGRELTDSRTRCRRFVLASCELGNE